MLSNGQQCVRQRACRAHQRAGTVQFYTEEISSMRDAEAHPICEFLEPRRLFNGTFSDAIGLQKNQGSLKDAGGSETYTIELKQPGWILAESYDFTNKLELTGGNASATAHAQISDESAKAHLDAGTFTLKITRLAPRRGT